MAFVFDQSAPATASAALRRWKDRLVTGGFTVVKSGDGSSYNSSGDQITADSGANSFANATGSWVQLRAPSSAYELVVQTNGGNQARVYQSVAGFSGGSPGAARVPTATDQQNVNAIGGGSDASPTYSQIFATDNTYRLFISVGDSSDLYDWWLATIPIGGGTPTTLCLSNGMVSGTYPSSDTDARCYLFDYAAGGVGQGGRIDSTGAGAPQARSSTNWRRCPVEFPCISGGTRVVSNAGLHAVTSQDWPSPVVCVLCESGPTWYGPKGVPKNIKGCLSLTASRVNGFNLTDGDSLNWVRIGDLWLRGDSTVPSLS